MRTSRFIITAILLSGFIFSLCFSVQKNEQGAEEYSSPVSVRPPTVKTVDFHLRDGRLVFGKLISEDKNKITIEELDESRIISTTYSKREVDARTMHTKSILEYKYYTDLAEYFAARTWDFIDDPDDFIQAIRCYEKAKQIILQTQTPESEKVRQIEQKIKNVKSDRDIWTEQTQSRAKLKSLEFETEVEKRLERLEYKVKTNSNNLERNSDDTRKRYLKIKRDISDMEKDISQQFDTMTRQIESNTALLARIDDYLRWHRWYPPPPPPPQPQNP